LGFCSSAFEEKEVHQQKELECCQALANLPNHIFDSHLMKKHADWDNIAFCLGVQTLLMNATEVVAEIFTQLQNREQLQAEPRYAAIWKALLKCPECRKTVAGTAGLAADAVRLTSDLC
jgi:hypothetical protein